MESVTQSLRVGHTIIESGHTIIDGVTQSLRVSHTIIDGVGHTIIEWVTQSHRVGHTIIDGVNHTIAERVTQSRWSWSHNQRVGHTIIDGVSNTITESGSHNYREWVTLSYRVDHIRVVVIEDIGQSGKTDLKKNDISGFKKKVPFSCTNPSTLLIYGTCSMGKKLILLQVKGIFAVMM